MVSYAIMLLIFIFSMRYFMKTSLQPSDIFHWKKNSDMLTAKHRSRHWIYKEVIIVASWTIWCHWNSILFYGGTLSLDKWMKSLKDELTSLRLIAKHSLKPLLNSCLIIFNSLHRNVFIHAHNQYIVMYMFSFKIYELKIRYEEGLVDDEHHKMLELRCW